MARKSGLEQMLDLAFKLRPRNAFITAAVLFVILQCLASLDVPKADPAHLGAGLSTQLFKAIGAFGRWILPGVFLIGGITRLLRQRSDVDRFEWTARKPEVRLSSLSWQQFERLVAEFYHRRGYEVRALGGAQPDGGVDIELTRGQELKLIQCKQWRAQRVGVEVVRELYGVMAARAAAAGAVVTSGAFTSEARAFAQGREIELVDGVLLAQLLREPGLPNDSAWKSADQPAGAPAYCPRCGASMIPRVARKGANAGQKFLGCSTFPRCKGTRSV